MFSNQLLKYKGAVRRNTNSVADTTEDYTNQSTSKLHHSQPKMHCGDVFCSLDHTIGSTYKHQAAACSLSLLVWMDMRQDKSSRLTFPSLLRHPPSY